MTLCDFYLQNCPTALFDFFKEDVVKIGGVAVAVSFVMVSTATKVTFNSFSAISRPGAMTQLSAFNPKSRLIYFSINWDNGH